MPFALIVIGLLLIVTSAKDTHTQLGAQIVKDFTGKDSFIVWILALGIIGFIGYVEKFRPISNAFLVLVLLAMFLSNSKRGDILTLIKDGLTNPVAPAKPTTQSPSGSPSAGGKEESSSLGTIGAVAGGAVGMMFGVPPQLGAAAGGAIGGQLGKMGD